MIFRNDLFAKNQQPMHEFKETQKFNILWIWVILIPIFFYTLYAVWQQVFEGNLIGTNPAPDWIVIATALFVLLQIILLVSTELRTTLSDEGVKASFFPFKTQRYFWSEIESYTIEEYKGAGVGMKFNLLENMRFYNMAKGEMLILSLKNGKKFGVGTQKPQEMKEYLDNLLFNNSTKNKDIDASHLLGDILKNKEAIELKNKYPNSES